MSSKTTLFVAVLVLFLTNFFIINSFTISESRIIRVFSTLTFFIFFIHYKGYKEAWLLKAIILFLISDILIIFYEISFANKLTSVMKTLGYFSLIIHVIKKLEIKKFKASLFSFFYVFISFINFYGLYIILSKMDNPLNDDFQKILLYIHGITIILTCTIATNYNTDIKKSMYFVFLVFGFSLTDFCDVLAYYFNVPSFFYISRTMYLSSLFLMIIYVITPTDNKKVINYTS